MGGRHGRTEFLLSARYQYEDYSGLRLPSSSPAPQVPDYHRGARTTRGLDRASYSALGRMTYDVSDDLQLFVSGYASAIERGAELSDWVQLSQPLDAAGRQSQNHVALQNLNAAVGGDLRASDTWTLGAQLIAFQASPLPSDRIEVGSSVYYVERDFDSRGLEGQLTSSWTFQSLSLSAAAGGIIDDQRLPSVEHVLKLPSAGQEPGEVREETSVRQDRKVFWNPGARVQAIYRPLPSLNLDLTGGGRYDYHSIYGHRVTGRAGVVYSPTERHNFKLLYGSAIKAPTTLLLYGTPLQPGDIQGNPDLKPQLVRTAELFGTFAPASFLTLTTGLAFSRLTDKTEYLRREGNLEAQNVAELNSLTWESEATVNYQRFVSAYVNAAYTRARRSTGLSGYQQEVLGVEATAYPSYVVNAGVRVRPIAGLVVGNELSWMSRHLAADNNILDNGGAYYLPGRAVWDANIRYTQAGLLGDARESAVALRGRNLLGELGPSPGFGGADYPLAPRTLMLTLSQEF